MSDQKHKKMNQSVSAGYCVSKKSMETDRSVFEQHWQEIAERILPRSAEFKGTEAEGR